MAFDHHADGPHPCCRSPLFLIIQHCTQYHTSGSRTTTTSPGQLYPWNVHQKETLPHGQLSPHHRCCWMASTSSTIGGSPTPYSQSWIPRPQADPVFPLSLSPVKQLPSPDPQVTILCLDEKTLDSSTPCSSRLSIISYWTYNRIIHAIDISQPIQSH
jgi:hypothetical protein